MKFLVFSDSHSSPNRILKAVNMHAGKCHAIIFLGDGIRDLSLVEAKYPEIPILKVKGNCDLGFSEVQEEQIYNFDGINILITHGHKHGVKYGYDSLIYYAQEKEVDAVLFGHTHVPCEKILYFDDKRLTLFNPGSIATEGTFGVINIANGVLVTNTAKIH
ncbi:MAG: YfcE family phosphodiesterase [Clostridia bacterium]|nr:YfcE family phosphodiesterase [Clostridia bacterium]